MSKASTTGSASELKAPLLNESEIQRVCELAEEAGRLAADMRALVNVREKSDPTDLVTDADLALSKLLLKELQELFPKDFLISEEDVPENFEKSAEAARIWYIDPIDGTDNYVAGDGQYAVMLGLLVAGKPHFGCVYSPAYDITYFGGPAYGSYIKRAASKASSIAQEYKPELKSDWDSQNAKIRLMMGSRDRKSNPWVHDLSNVEIIASGSVGMKVSKVLNDEADLYVHLSGKLKYWDTVAPIAIAHAAGLESGTLEEDSLPYPLSKTIHPEAVIIGRRGALEWSRELIGKSFLSK